MTTLTKISYARGICQALQQAGRTQFASPEMLKIASNEAAAHMDRDPAFFDMDDNDTLKVAEVICAVHDNVAGAYKTASIRDNAVFTRETFAGDLLEKVGHATEGTLQKLAANADIGSMVGTHPQDNSLANAARQTQMGRQELAERPENYANVGQGGANFDDVSGGMIGMQMKHPKGEAVPPGSNSAMRAGKTASVINDLNKLAAGMGATNQHGASPTGGHGDNSLSASASQSQMGMDENMRRPEGYANVGQGNTNFSEPQSSRIGEEMPHPHAEGHATPNGTTNSAMEASKAAAYQAYFTELYNEMSPKLAAMGAPMEQRVALVKHAMSLEPREHRGLMSKVAKHFGYDDTPAQDTSLQTLLRGI